MRYKLENTFLKLKIGDEAVGFLLFLQNNSPNSGNDFEQELSSISPLLPLEKNKFQY
jgi:hypothetical protein